MTKTTKLWDMLGSRNLSVYIFITALTYILFLVCFSAAVPAWWVSNISRLLPFKILYILFFVNLVVCEIKWIPVIIKRCGKPEIPITEEDYQRFRHKVVVSGQWSVVSRGLERYLRRRGYRVRSWESSEPKVRGQESEEKNFSLPTPHSSPILYAYKGRFSPIGNLLFHASFLLILAGVLFSMISHFEKNLLLMEGQSSEDGFDVVEIKPQFWKEKLLFTDLMAGIKSDKGEDEVRISQAARINGSKITIQGIGYTPKYVLRNMNGDVVDVGYVNLVNFIPGSVDNFSIPGFPYKIYVSIYPDFEVREGKVGTRSMNLNNPRYGVRVVRGKTMVYSGMLGLRDEAFFEDFSLSFPEIKYNSTFRIIIDKGEPLIWTGFILMIAGLIWKLLFYRREIAVMVFGDEIYFYLNSDYYHALLLKKCTTVL